MQLKFKNTKYFRLVILIFLILLVACHSPKGNIKNSDNKNKITAPFSKKGILLRKGETNLLLINNKTPLKSDDSLKTHLLIEKYKNNLIVMDLTKVDSKELSQGQTIEVWFDELQESFPPKATVKKYHILVDK
ncbi:YobA family protein [Bacillus safensis]|uniref:YobA family protein n=1 Tax=Bacillus TaxID=1386 RepID=UPI0021552005|nr:YobA family protein [Bacillus safensis]MED0802140.1 YobA family protein [Bacillus safensis]